MAGTGNLVGFNGSERPFVWIGSSGGSFQLWRTGPSNEAKPLLQASGAIAVSPRGDLVICRQEHSTEIYVTGRVGGLGAPVVRVPEGEATAFTFSPDGGRLYVGTEEGEIKVLDSERLFGDQVVHLGKDTIRWGPAKRAPTQAPSFSCKARLLSRTDQIAEAFPEVEFLEIELTVKNVGEGAAHCLTGTFPDDPPTVYFGSLPPGASVVRRVWVAAYKARVRPQTFTLTLADQWGHRFRPFNTSF